jgi:TetR/AcrR family transcriptional repressor of nem operon
VLLFFDENERWLVKVLEQGREDATLTFSDAAPVVAQSIISGLEGALLVARPYGDVPRFERAADRLIASLVGIPDAQPRTL